MALPDPTQVSGPAGARLDTPTHDGSGEATHPSVVHIPEGFGGYEYWMGMTPYPGSNNSHEDPNILASHDGITWVVPDGLVNPIDDQPGGDLGYNSDTDLRFYDNTLWLFWRTYIDSATGAEENLYYATSGDGITWTAKTLFYQSDRTVRRLVSPALLFEGGAWAMWAVDITPDTHQVVRVQGGALPETGWATPVVVDMGPMQTGRQPWHFSIIRTADGYIALLNDTLNDMFGTDGDLLFCVSTDGFTFTNSGHSVIPHSLAGEYDALYRACLIPDTVEGVEGWRVWYGADLLGPPTVWHIYRTWISVPVPDPDPTPIPGGEASPSATVEWFACDLVTGAKTMRLPLAKGTFSRSLSSHTSTVLTLPIPTAGPGQLLGLAYQILQAPTTMYVCVVNNVPAWGGILLKPTGGTSSTTQLGLVSIEGYLNRRYVADHEWVQVDKAQIVAGLVEDAQDEGIGLVIDAPNTGDLMDRTYWDDENATVYKRLQELAEVEDGIEWTVDLEWTDDRMTHVRKVFRARERIGRADPVVTLSSRSDAFASYEWTVDYSEGRGANDVQAYAPGQGEDRPRSARVRAENQLADGVPRFEYRWQPSSSISKPATLDQHARRKLAELAYGTQYVTVTCRWNAEDARLGIDWNLGDTVNLDLWGHLDPAGRQVTGRVVGYDFDPDAGTVTPAILLEA